MSGSSKNRLVIFGELRTHPWYGKFFQKLGVLNIADAQEFIIENLEDSVEDFEYKLNRLFLDREKPKEYTRILELLSATNSLYREGLE